MAVSKPVAKQTIDTNVNLEKIRLDAKEMVKSRAKISAGVAIIPVPFLDVAIDVAMLSKLLPEITRKFGLEDELERAYTEEQRKQNMMDKIMAVGSLVAARGVVNKTVQGFGGRIIGKQVAKYVPLGGQIVAATIGYMIFKKIADDHVEECYKIAKAAQQSA